MANNWERVAVSFNSCESLYIKRNEGRIVSWCMSRAIPGFDKNGIIIHIMQQGVKFEFIPKNFYEKGKWCKQAICVVMWNTFPCGGPCGVPLLSSKKEGNLPWNQRQQEFWSTCFLNMHKIIPTRRWDIQKSGSGWISINLRIK